MLSISKVQAKYKSGGDWAVSKAGVIWVKLVKNWPLSTQMPYMILFKFACGHLEPNRENEGSKNLIFAIQKRRIELVAPDFLACGEIF